MELVTVHLISRLYFLMGKTAPRQADGKIPPLSQFEAFRARDEASMPIVTVRQRDNSGSGAGDQVWQKGNKSKIE